MKARKTPKTVHLGGDPFWYKDAIIYEVHVKTFFDSNNDGIGDFNGLISKLDYLQNLGITAIWLLPFYPSPLRDDGYDIADYCNVHPAYGTLHDFRELLRRAHQRGIRVITELVLNHTSDQHPWFQKSRRAKGGSAWRDFYVWSGTADKYGDARIIFKDFETSNWTWDTVRKEYYWHRFYSHQPDLNYENPRVHKEMLNAIDFWFDMGVDGLRLDAVPYLYEREGTHCENLPETHAFLKKLRSHVERKFGPRMLIAEANQWPEDAMAYFGDGDECHAAFNFPVMPRMFMAIQMEDRFPISDILDPPLVIPDSCQWILFLRNHDELTLEMVTDEERDYMYRVYARDPRTKINLGIRRRLAPLLANNRRKIELMNALLFSLPGTPVIYYGDEIGMGDNYYLGDRNGVRTPMQWSPDRNSSFSKANPQKLYLPVIIDPEYHYESVNVENQQGNLSSLLWWTRRVIAMRRRFKAFGRGDIHFLSPQNPKILAFVRAYEGEIVLVVINLSRFSQVVELDLSEHAGLVPEEMFSQNRFPAIRQEPYLLTLGPHNHFWFVLKKEKEVTVEGGDAWPQLVARTAVSEIFEGEMKRRLEREILAKYLRRSRWFAGKGRRISKLTVVEDAPIFGKNDSARLLLLEVEYTEGQPDIYCVPLLCAWGHEALVVKEQTPQAVISDIRVGEREGIFYDGVYGTQFQGLLLDMIWRRKKLKGSRGEFVACPGRGLKALLSNTQLPLSSSVLKVEQSNSSIVYGNSLILKLFRKLQDGVNPDVELVKYLTERARFSAIPAFMGAMEYRRYDGSEFLFTGLLQRFVQNHGDAWTFTLQNITEYYDRMLSRRVGMNEGRSPVFSPGMDLREYPLLNELIGAFYLEMIGLLGQRTGEMHLSLASPSVDPEFEPEPFSMLYQRSAYQSMRSLVRQVFGLLRKNVRMFSGTLSDQISEVLACEGQILGRMERILERRISGMKIRTHGDYHLGQVLFTGKDFVIIDFEGEPARPLSERRLKRSPLRDVAGMLRSFHYAVYDRLLVYRPARAAGEPLLESYAKLWYHYVSRVFLQSYLDTVSNASFLPKKREEFSTLFEGFLLEKAVYELGYELNNRPDWIIIPLRGIRDTLSQSSPLD